MEDLKQAIGLLEKEIEEVRNFKSDDPNEKTDETEK